MKKVGTKTFLKKEGSKQGHEDRGFGFLITTRRKEIELIIGIGRGDRARSSAHRTSGRGKPKPYPYWRPLRALLLYGSDRLD